MECSTIAIQESHIHDFNCQEAIAVDEQGTKSEEESNYWVNFGLVGDDRQMFDKMPLRNVVFWRLE